jgi:F0F1-type ATP synthase membrane subunit a
MYTEKVLVSPLEQFDFFMIALIYKNLYISNFTIILILNFIVFLLMLRTAQRSHIFIFNNFTYFIYTLFAFVRSILIANLSTKNSSFIFLFLFLFYIILISNIVGLIPYSITITTQFFFTFYYALAFFIGIILIGVFHHQEKFFITFLPAGIPLVIVPSLIIIEYVSYF